MLRYYTSCSLIFILPLVLSLQATPITNSNSNNNVIITDHGGNDDNNNNNNNNINSTNPTPGELVYLIKFGEIFQFCYDIRIKITKLLSSIMNDKNYSFRSTDADQIITRLSNMILNNKRSVADLRDILNIYVNDQQPIVDNSDITIDNSVVLNDSIRNSYAKYQVQNIYAQFQNNSIITPGNLMTIEISMYAIQSQLKSLYADLQQLVYFKRLTPSILSYKQFKKNTQNNGMYRNISFSDYRHCELDIFKYYDDNNSPILAFLILAKTSSSSSSAIANKNNNDNNNNSSSHNNEAYFILFIFCAIQIAAWCCMIIIGIIIFCKTKKGNGKQRATPCHYNIKYNDDNDNNDDDNNMDKPLPTEKEEEEEEKEEEVKDLKSRIDGNYTSYPTYVDYSF